jgi:16S rRNA (guanine527-N7)-methyltransferase
VETAAALELANVRVLTGRAEDWGHDPAHRERYGLVTARAVAPLPVLLELTLPLARPGGVVAAMKSESAGEELAQSAVALRRLGGAPPDMARTLFYDRHDGRRACVCLLGKATATPGAYPRPPGVPKRRPLR